MMYRLIVLSMFGASLSRLGYWISASESTSLAMRRSRVTKASGSSLSRIAIQTGESSPGAAGW
jgi:hypothetical protein